MVTPIAPDQLVRVLRRAQDPDDLGTKINDALALIESVLDDLSEQAVALSFNGGKDCTVLLHLFAVALFARHADVPEDLRTRRERIDIPSAPSSSTTESIPRNPVDGSPSAPAAGPSTSSQRAQHIISQPPLPYSPIKSIYITAPNHFDELDTFTNDSVTRYGMDLYRFGGDMKAALTEYLRCGGGKGVRGVLVGTRTGDPNGRKRSGRKPAKKRP
jgi:FAD synthetase